MISAIGKTQGLRILNTLKRTQGLSVQEIASRLNMSYMGIKQHCVNLQKGGYLDTWRRPKPIGRPELAYRLTRRAHELFPVASNRLTVNVLEAAEKLFGPSASEKLLFRVFQKNAEDYRSRIKGDTVALRAKWFARLRDNEGFMSGIEAGDSLKIVEHHSPILDLVEAYPIVRRLEAEMFQRVLSAPVRREDISAGGLYCAVFHIE